MKKEIIIKKENETKIMQAIREVQGKARERVIESFEQIVEITAEVEKRLGIGKTSLTGIEVVYDFRQHFPTAYHGIPMSTHIKLVYRNGSWRLADVQRKQCPNKNSVYEYEVILTEAARDAVITRLGFNVQA